MAARKNAGGAGPVGGAVSRRWAALAVAVLLVAGPAACGDGGTTAPQVTDLDVVEGLYDVQTITFDPQGSAPAADVLNALEESGRTPELNVGRTGSFQLVYRDPVSGNLIR